MDKNKIIQYIQEGKEIELLRKLELLGLNEYNDKYKRLIQILVVLLNNTEKNFLPIQQFLFKTIYAALKEIVKNESNIQEFVDILKVSSDNDYQNISNFIYRFILNIKDDVEGIKRLNNMGLLEKKLKLVNIDFLKELVSNKKEYTSIVYVFYHCVDTLEENRRVILHPNAISLFYQYVIENPEGYLSHFIRPYYTGPTRYDGEYYQHVPEPFCEQIFKDETFKQFLEQVPQKKVDKNLLNDILSFYTKAKSNANNTDKVVMLFSFDNLYSQNRDNHLQLQSENHVYVRESCKPPKYNSENE